MSYIFIDESGDAGFKFDKGSSRFFVMVAIIYDDSLEVEKTAVAIKSLRRKIGFSDNKEFKFNKLNKEFRVKFFKETNIFKFKVKCLTIDKKTLKDRGLRSDKDSFYAYAVKMFLKRGASSVLGTKVKLDGSGDKIFRRNFFSYLRKELNQEDKRMIRNVRFVDSKDNQLIQLADMVAGAIRRSLEEGKSDKDTYKSIFKKHIEDEWNLER